MLSCPLEIRVRGSVIQERLEVEWLLLNIKRGQLKEFRFLVRMSLDTSLGRFFGYVQLEDPEKVFKLAGNTLKPSQKRVERKTP